MDEILLIDARLSGLKPETDAPTPTTEYSHHYHQWTYFADLSPSHAIAAALQAQSK